MHIVGQQMPRVLKNQTTILEHLLPDGLLDDYYVNALGFPQFSIWLARMAKQLTHRYPHMDIIEIGGTLLLEKDVCLFLADTLQVLEQAEPLRAFSSRLGKAFHLIRSPTSLMAFSVKHRRFLRALKAK